MATKRQTTAAKRDREQALREKRARKDEKKQAARDLKAAGGAPVLDGEAVLADRPDES